MPALRNSRRPSLPRNHSTRSRQRRLRLEALERRWMLATVEVSQAGGALVLTGDKDPNSALVDDSIAIAFGNGSFTITGSNGTTLIPPSPGSSQVVIPASGITSIQVRLATGNDSISLATHNLPVPVEVHGGAHATTPTTAVVDGQSTSASSSFSPRLIQVPLGDFLVLDDSASSTLNAAYTISATQVTRNGAALVSFPDADFERLTLTAAAGNNDVTADVSAGALPAIVQVLAATGDTLPVDNRFQVIGGSQADNISIRDFDAQLNADDVGPILGPDTAGPLAVTYDSNGLSLVDALTARPLPGGVTIASATFTGSNTAAGRYVNGDDVPLGILREGIILTSGDAKQPTTNTVTDFGKDSNLPGDPDVEELVNLGNTAAPFETHDAAVLTITIDVAANSGIQSGAFNFQFGSEEYDEFVGDIFNDTVGAFINGDAATNVMRDAQGRPISINSVFFEEDNLDDSRHIEYDGLTSALVARFPLHPGTNTLKIAIADAGDFVLDSGVLLADLRFSSQAVGPGGTSRATGHGHFELSGFQRLWARGNGGDDVIDNVSSVPGLLDGGEGGDAINSVVSVPSQLVINPIDVRQSTISNVNLALGGGGADKLYAGTADANLAAKDVGLSFLVGDYSPDGMQPDGTYNLFKLVQADNDAYTSSTGGGTTARHGLVSVGSDAAPVGAFAYQWPNVHYLLRSPPTGPHYIYPAAFNPLVKQLQLFTQPVVGAPAVQTGSITGTNFNDLDGNGVRGAAEPGLAGVTVYVDLNDNGSLGAGEPSAVTGAQGQYTISNLAPGSSYVVREVVPSGMVQTLPANGAYRNVVVVSNQVTGGLDFGNTTSAPPPPSLIAIDDSYTIFPPIPDVGASATILPLGNDVFASSTTRVTNVTRITTNTNANLTIDPADSKVLRFAATPNFRETAIFQYTIDDDNAATLPATALITFQVTDQETTPSVYLAQLQATAIGLVSDSEIFSITEGQQFRLQVQASDLRSGGSLSTRGVVSAYLDLLLNPLLNTTFVRPVVDANNPLGFAITFDSSYDVARTGAVYPTTATSKMVNEVGAARSGSPAQGASTVFTILMQAVTATPTGQPLQILADHADTGAAVVAIAPDSGVGGPRVLTDSEVFLVAASPLTISSAAMGEPDSLDVNQDGSVSPGDALIIINDLNVNGSRQVTSGQGTGEGEPSLSSGANPLLDVNQDSYVTAADALAVINALNAARDLAAADSGEGEGPFAADLPEAGAAADELLSLLASDLADADRRDRRQAIADRT